MPSSFLHYDILGKLGEGGMGIVYLAKDTKLNRKVALKFLPNRVSVDPEERSRFKQEAQAAAALNHSNIAQVYAIEEIDDDQELFIVMEFVDGADLKEVIAAGKLTLQQKKDIALQIAQGIKAAHDQKIIHRDIKAANIMMDSSGRIKIMDFGLARIQGTAHITKPGTTVGTTSYMAPEQLAGDEADVQSDIWSYGVVLYELFTGDLPFKGLYEPAVMYAITEEDPAPVAQKAGEIPSHYEAVIERCLQKNRDNRFDSFEEIISNLTEASPAVTRTTQSPADKYSQPAGGKKRYVLASASVFLFVVTILLLLFTNSLTWTGNSVPQKKYLAVLPIENIGGNPDLQAICDGLAEMFSYKLSEVEKYQDSYWVTPASEMRREQVASVTQANKLFGVNLAISSSIQTMQDSTRLILELVDADNIRRLDSEQIVVASNELATLERHGVQAVLRMLHIEMNPQMNNSLAQNQAAGSEAYKLYLKGLSDLRGYDNTVDLDRAIEQFQQATEADPEFALAYAGLGEAYWRKYETTGTVEMVKEAEKALNSALQINERLAPVQTLLGMLKSGTGDQEQAIVHFGRAIEIDPKYYPAYQGMARAFEQQGNSDKAANTYKRAIDLKPEYWAGYKDLGIYYLNKGEISNAIGQLEKVIELTPKNSTAFSNLGVAYYYDGQNAKARQMFEQSLALERNPLTANNLAGIYYWEGKYEQAAGMYEIALEAYSNRYEIWGNLAAAYELSGQHQQAQKTYFMAIEKALAQLEVNANAPEVIADLGAYYSDVGDTSNALENIERALELNSDNLRVRQRAVSTFEKLGARDRALNWIQASMIADIESQPELTDLVRDPRFIQLKQTLTQTAN